LPLFFARVFGLGARSAGCLHMERDGMRMFIYVAQRGILLARHSTTEAFASTNLCMKH
jgi:hypothetical protein